jgi:polar amino acid transport system substrate-binding protein
MSGGWRLSIVAAFVALALASGCESARDSAEQRFLPAADGVLTVATALPAPGFWDGDRAATVDGGFEYSIASALADRFGLDLEVVDVPFDDLVAGDLGGADLALAQIAVTDERADVVDFSFPYYDDQMGVVMQAGEEMRDLATARDATWVVEEATVEEEVLTDDIRPRTEPLVVGGIDDAIAAVASGHVEAALIDLSSALVTTDERDDVSTVARLVVNQQFAAAMPLGTVNAEVVDAALRAFESSGQLDEWRNEYLLPLFETDPDDLPVIRTPR